METFNQRIMNTQYPVCTLDLHAYMANTLVIVANHLIDMSHFRLPILCSQFAKFILSYVNVA